MSLPQDKESLLRVEKLLQIRDCRVDFAKNHHLNTNGDKMDFSDPYLADIYNSLSPTIVLQSSVQSGKCSGVNSLVHTPLGWVRMGDIKPGDVISCPSGGEQTVLDVFPQGVLPLFKITFYDGRSVEVSEDHLWRVTRSKKRVVSDRPSGHWDVSLEQETLTTRQIQEDMATGKFRFSIPVPEPVEKPELGLPLCPYVLGVLLGDGYFGKSITLAAVEDDLLDDISDGLSTIGCSLKRRDRRVLGVVGNTAGLKKILRDLNLLGKRSWEKHIPWEYKNGSVAQRLAILQGLMDTDGTSCKHGGNEFSTTSPQLKRDILEIAWSLGGAASCVERQTKYTHKGVKKLGRPSFRVIISMPRPKDLFRMERKQDRVSETRRRLRTLGPVITSIDFSKNEEAQCIVVDHPDHLYIMDDYVVTHNSEFLIIDHLSMAVSGLSVLFVLPKYDLRNRFVQNRINKCVERVPKYREILGSGFFDSMSLKYFGNGTVNYVGSNVEKDFFEIPVNCAVVDEYDQCDQNNLRFVDDRMSSATNMYPFTRFAGNPKYKGRGINGKYEKSDQREWNVNCKSCGKLSSLDWFKNVVDVTYDKSGSAIDVALRDKEWSPGMARDVHIICPCGGILDRLSKQGVWLPTNPEGLYEGYLISKLFTRQSTMRNLWDSFKDCIYDPSLMDWFYGSCLGKPSEASGNRVTEALLDGCSEGPRLQPMSLGFEAYGVVEEFPPGVCSMGVDVGKYLDIRVSYNKDFHRVCVFLGRATSKEQLYDIMRRYNVASVVIDSGPELHMVDEIQLKAPSPVWKCRFLMGEGRAAKIDYKPKELSISVDRTFLLDRTLSHFREHKNIVPENFRNIFGGAYMKQMTAPVREKLIDDNGQERYVWKKGEDHHFLADAYDVLASDFVQYRGFDVEVL